MDLNPKHYRNYYDIRPGEGPRDIYGTFSDSQFKDVCKCAFTHPFKVDLGRNGRRNVGIAIRSFSVTNSPCNVSSRNHTDVVFLEGSGDPTEVRLRPGFYETVGQVVTEINTQTAPGTVTFETDHLGIVRYTGATGLVVPYKVDGKTIPDNMATRLGFDAAALYEASTIRSGRYECITIQPGLLGAGPGDMYGPCAECLITCDECYYTPETDRVVCVTSLASNPPRSHISHCPQIRFRPLQDGVSIPELTLRLVDRSQRPLSFLSGVPCVIIELMHLD